MINDLKFTAMVEQDIQEGYDRLASDAEIAREFRWAQDSTHVGYLFS